MRQAARRLSEGLRRAEEWLSYIAAGAIAAMMVITVADVIGRYLFRVHLAGSYEYVALLFVYLIFLGLAYAQRQDAHITIGVLYDRLPRRARLVTAGLVLSLSFMLFAVLTWYSAKSAWVNYVLGDTMLGAIQVATWPSRIAIPIGCGLVALRLLVQLVRVVTRGELYEETLVGGRVRAAGEA